MAPHHLSRDEYVERQRARAREVARRVLAGQESVVLAARELTQVLARLEDPSLASALQVFVAVESETDHLPVGAVRKLWAPEALAERDQELAQAEAVHATDVADACRELLNALEPA